MIRDDTPLRNLSPLDPRRQDPAYKELRRRESVNEYLDKEAEEKPI